VVSGGPELMPVGDVVGPVGPTVGELVMGGDVIGSVGDVIWDTTDEAALATDESAVDMEARSVPVAVEAADSRDVAWEKIEDRSWLRVAKRPVFVEVGVGEVGVAMSVGVGDGEPVGLDEPLVITVLKPTVVPPSSVGVGLGVGEGEPLGVAGSVGDVESLLSMLVAEPTERPVVLGVEPSVLKSDPALDKALPNDVNSPPKPESVELSPPVTCRLTTRGK
jgi:hypothetical protein